MLTKWGRCGPLLLVCTLAAACGEESREMSTGPMEPMRAECFGRHEISMPESFRFQHSGSSATFYYGHDADFETVEAQVADSGLEPQRFAASVASRAADISSESNEKTRGSMLLAHEEIDASTFLAVSSSSDGSVEGGFCLGGLRLDPADDYEAATFSYRSRDRAHRDVAFAIVLGTFKRDETAPRVAQRLDGNFSGLGLRPGVLRKGTAELGGAPAEQWLVRERVDGQVEHLFVAESYPASPGLRNPTLQIELRTGGSLPSQPGAGLPPYRRPSMPPSTDERVGSSLSADRAIAIWDEMMRSIRVR